MVPAQPPNTHPSPHLMQKDATNLLNLPRRGTISGVQNVTLYCKIDIVIQLFRLVYKWSLAQGLQKTLDPLLLYQKNLRYEALKNRLLVLCLFKQSSNTHYCARSAKIKKKQCYDKNKRTSCLTQNEVFSNFFRQNDKRASNI